MIKPVLINGDCLDVLKTYPDNYFTSVITDAPYGYAFMGKKWDYQVPSIEIWKECLRVLKHGGTMLCFAGSRTQHRMAVNIEDAGFIIKDCLMWLYGSGFPKSLNVGKAVDKLEGNEREFVKTISSHDITSGGLVGKEYSRQDINVTKGISDFEGYGTALKPAYEPIIMCMKPNDDTYANNAIKHGVAGINIDKSRIEGNIKHQLGGWHHEHTINDDGWKGNIQSIKEPQGRFPANIILDEEAGQILGDKSRFFYCAKASPSERNAGCEALEAKFSPTMNNGIGIKEHDPETATKKNNHHPTVKPLSLMKYLINLIMPPKEGLILDPFMGSGTTLLASKQLGYNAVGIELDKEYFEIAKARLGETND